MTKDPRGVEVTKEMRSESYHGPGLCCGKRVERCPEYNHGSLYECFARTTNTDTFNIRSQTLTFLCHWSISPLIQPFTSTIVPDTLCTHSKSLSLIVPTGPLKTGRDHFQPVRGQYDHLTSVKVGYGVTTCGSRTGADTMKFITTCCL